MEIYVINIFILFVIKICSRTYASNKNNIEIAPTYTIMYVKPKNLKSYILYIKPVKINTKINKAKRVL